MKIAMKILAALAAVVGVVYVIATYGDKIVAWAKNLLASCPCCNSECEIVEEDFVAEEAPAEEAPVAEEPATEETPAEVPEVEIVVESNEPVAEESDFEA
jgi:hypothetical protein